METTFEIRWRRQRRGALVFLYVVFLLNGVANGLLLGPGEANVHPDVVLRVSLLFAIAMSLGFMWFCTADARLVGKPLLPLARIGIFILWPAGVPVYLLWARRLRGLGLLLLHGFLLLLLFVVSMLAAGYLVYGDKVLA